jgi:hypothetical protein
MRRRTMDNRIYDSRGVRKDAQGHLYDQRGVRRIDLEMADSRAARHAAISNYQRPSVPVTKHSHSASSVPSSGREYAAMLAAERAARHAEFDRLQAQSDRINRLGAYARPPHPGGGGVGIGGLILLGLLSWAFAPSEGSLPGRAAKGAARAVIFIISVMVLIFVLMLAAGHNSKPTRPALNTPQSRAPQLPRPETALPSAPTETPGTTSLQQHINNQCFSRGLGWYINPSNGACTYNAKWREMPPPVPVPIPEDGHGNTVDCFNMGPGWKPDGSRCVYMGDDVAREELLSGAYPITPRMVIPPGAPGFRGTPRFETPRQAPKFYAPHYQAPVPLRLVPAPEPRRAPKRQGGYILPDERRRGGD